jgi:hypothetical protein
MAKYGSTLLPQSNDPVEIQKASLDLLSKINETSSGAESAQSAADAANQRIAALEAQIAAMQIMSGSNANGNWIKFPDGTMECWIISLPSSTNGSSGSGTPCNRFGVATWTYPSQFIAPPFVSCGMSTASTVDTADGAPSSVTNISAVLIAFYYSPAGASTIALRGYAIGRWK